MMESSRFFHAPFSLSSHFSGLRACSLTNKSLMTRERDFSRFSGTARRPQDISPGLYLISPLNGQTIVSTVNLSREKKSAAASGAPSSISASSAGGAASPVCATAPEHANIAAIVAEIAHFIIANPRQPLTPPLTITEGAGAANLIEAGGLTFDEAFGNPPEGAGPVAGRRGKMKTTAASRPSFPV